MTEADSSAAPHFANVIAETPGRCFRYVADDTRGGYPMPCSEPVVVSGVMVNPAGKRIAVDACAGHAPDLIERHPLT